MTPRALALLAMTTLLSTAAAQAPTGIPRELARTRAARLSDLRYKLAYALTPKASTTEATEHLTFTLTDNRTPLLLDFRDGEISALTLNGAPLPTTLDNGHVLLPAVGLHPGPNAVEIHFRAHIAPAEKAITRFEDKDDGSEYLYTLFVPMDAHMAFPCFDQPDLKARFQLSVGAPHDWTIISNTAATHKTSSGTISETTFAETEPISTYLFAFAAGPFQRIHPDPTLPGLYVRQSRAQQAATEAPIIQHTAAEGIQYLSKYFAQPFPFPKYDMVLIPGFAYGGMEHAGATFLREESVLFRTAPTETNRFNRDTLVLHELTHQWFGDFTTMRWFDDLWLKEGFAQYMAYQALATMRPPDDVWKRFYQSIKPNAYAIDQTLGTTPIYQDIPNLNDAKSAYGAIVYSKAPGVIHQLHYVLGDQAFQQGLQTYLAQHKYANAEWSDLVHAFEKSSNKNLTTWADMWIKDRGMPVIETQWSCSNSVLSHLQLTQRSVLADDPQSLWPIASEITAVLPDGSTRRIDVAFHTRSQSLPVLTYRAAIPCPAYIFANHDDHAYGLFLLDETSRTYLLHHPEALTASSATSPRNQPGENTATSTADPSANGAPHTSLGRRPGSTKPPQTLSAEGATRHSATHIPANTDANAAPTTTSNLNRTLLWGALWDSVREAQLPPAEYLRLALTALPAEHDESLAASLLARSAIALHRYLPADQRTTLSAKFQQLAADQMLHNPSQDLRINYFRSLPAFSEAPTSHALLKSILDEHTAIPGVTLRPQDRWSLVTSLIAYSDPEAGKYFAAEKHRDPSGDGQKFAFAAGAARPTPASKQRYFYDFLHTPAPSEKQLPEDWVETALSPFNSWNQTALTEPFLQSALQALPQIKRQRKIFFLVAWLDAFLLNQQTPAAQHTVHAFLEKPGLDPDLRLKILQSLDELDRTVRIRANLAQ